MELGHKGQNKKSPPDHLARRTLPESLQRKTPPAIPDETTNALEQVKASEVPMHLLGVGVRYDPTLAACVFPNRVAQKSGGEQGRVTQPRTASTTTIERPSIPDPNCQLWPEPLSGMVDAPTVQHVEFGWMVNHIRCRATPLPIKVLFVLLRSLGFIFGHILKIAFGSRRIRRCRRRTVRPLIKSARLGESPIQ